MGFEHQDWQPVVFRKKEEKSAHLKGEAAIKAHMRSGVAVDTTKRIQGGKNSQSEGTPNAGKLDRETEELRHERISKETSRTIVQARLEKKMTQAQLAAHIFEPVNIVQSYENGTAIPSGQVLNKLSRALGVPLHK